MVLDFMKAFLERCAKAAEAVFLLEIDTKANSMTIILGVGIVLAVLSIWRFIPDYTYPVCHEPFFPLDEYEKERVDGVRTLLTKDSATKLFVVGKD